MVRLDELGERELVAMIGRLLRPSPGIGPGDDAAAIDLGDDWLVVSSDLLSFTSHRPAGTPWERVGWMAAAVNFSDIASMGAEPLGFISSLSLPPDMEERNLLAMVSGMDQCAEFCGTHVVGGDTKAGHGLVAGTALGIVSKGEILTRSGAKAGDLVAVTGPLGGPAAGWHALSAGLDMPEAVDCLTLPVPKVQQGRLLASTGAVNACMDISDGLSSTVHGICAASGVGMEIVWGALPVWDGAEEVAERTGASLEDMVLHYGGEYELLFTFPMRMLETLQSLDVVFSVIGRVVPDEEAVLIKGTEMEYLEDRGYEHFRPLDHWSED